MIIDIARFVAEEHPSWDELDGLLRRMEDDPDRRLDLKQVRRLHYLYRRASADLAKVVTFSAAAETRQYLEVLVARAYGEIHETRQRTQRIRPWRWFTRDFPDTFRRHLAAFWLATAITMAGCIFGGGIIAFDPEAKEIIIPFEHLRDSPAERVAREESATPDKLQDAKTTFAAYLMTHNIRVSVMAMALGMTCGLGTVILLFFNGVILGAIATEYTLAGQGTFLVGWLLPHGSIEIPAILIAGQAGLVLAGALIGRGTGQPLSARLRDVGRDLTTLIGGIAVLLFWAGFIESFFSQYHEPVLPYGVKIAFGSLELMLLALWLAMGGRDHPKNDRADQEQP
jgi:uncharacterized membrane protein SpoIIM required for sporulation